MSKREFRASLTSYVRESGEDRQLVDQRGRMLESLLLCPVETVLLMEQHDLAALLTCVCRPAAERGKVECQSREIRDFIDAIEKHDSGEGFEAELCDLLRYALKDGSLAHLVWKDNASVAVTTVTSAIKNDAQEEETASDPIEEPNSLFDRREETQAEVVR
ncbi:hypothetical protein IT407_01820 [Candidatus Uhrbacteria bacterium]|nr:hypothetical protein [Candidatus Uhrbacteria bacterium]